jgi:hypothetical protein
MSGAVTVDSTAGGTTVIATGPNTRLLIIANTGAADCYLKLDSSATAVTTANGHPLVAGGVMVLGFGAGPNGTDVGNMIVKAICATSTTLRAQSTP